MTYCVFIGLLFRTVEALELPDPRYPTLGRATYGLLGEQVASWAVTLQQFGACIAYTVVIADLLQPILEQTGATFFVSRWPLQLVVVVCVVFPLCLLPTLDSLKFVSTTSIALILLVVAITVGNGVYILSATDSDAVRQKLEHEHEQELHPHQNQTNAPFHSKLAMYPTGANFLSALPIISFSFLCHQNSFPIYVELEPDLKTSQSMDRIAGLSMGICCTTYLMSAFFGYITFVGQTEGNLILNFPTANSYIAVPMDVARVGFGLSFILSFPLMVWEARHNLDTLIFGRRKFGWRRHFMVTLFVVGVSCTIGIVSPNIQIVLELVGSTCSPIMVYILPGLFFLKAAPGPACSREKAPALGLLALGCTLVPVCLFMWVLRYIVCKGDGDHPALCTSLGITSNGTIGNHTAAELEELGAAAWGPSAQFAWSGPTDADAAGWGV